VRFVVHEVEDGDAVADWRQQAVAIFGEDEVAFAIDSAEQVRELFACQLISLHTGSPQHT
jgi:hypothetical protein